MEKMFKQVGTGLVTALCLLNITTFSIIPSYAATVSDLRDLLGITVENVEETPKNEYEVIVEKKDSKGESGTTSTTTSPNIQYGSKWVRLEERLKQGIDENTDTKTLVTILNSMYDIDSKVKAQNKANAYNSIGSAGSGSSNSGNNQAIIPENSIANDVAYDESEITLGDKDFSIGDIGSTSVSVTDEYRILVTPWGYTVDSEGNTSEKLLGVDFGVKQGDKINSQWNGIVTSIEDDGITGGKIVTVFHGNNLYTVYHHVKPIDALTAGSVTTQGEQIAYAIDTTTAEINKREHIFYQIILEGEYINPLVVYGDSGESLYESWYRSSTEVNVIDEEEEYFITEDIYNHDNYIKGNAEEVLYPDFNRED